MSATPTQPDNLADIRERYIQGSRDARNDVRHLYYRDLGRALAVVDALEAFQAEVLAFYKDMRGPLFRGRSCGELHEMLGVILRKAKLL